MLKVQHIITGMGAGGAQRVLARLIATTRSEIHQGVITLIAPSGPEIEQLERWGIQWKTVDVQHPISAVCSLFRAARQIAEFKPAIIHGWMYHANVYATWASWLSGIRVPVLWSVRHSAEPTAKDGLLTRSIIRGAKFFAGGATRIVFNSQRALEQHVRLGYPERKCLTIHNGFDLAMFRIDRSRGEKWRLDKALALEDLVIAHAGRYHPVKNHAGLLRAFAALKDRERVKLVLVGEGVDEGNSALVSLIASLGLTSSVKLFGPEQDMVGFYNASDFVVLPSFSEALPNVVGEAQCCGRLCIATDAGDTRELMVDTSWLVQPGDQNGLRERMQLALERGREQLGEMGLDLRARMEERFSIESMARRYTTLYHSLCRSRSCS